MKRCVTANAGKDYTCHVGDAGSSPACLATGSSVMGSTPALRSDVFSIPRRRDASREHLKNAANAGRTTSPCKRQVAGSSPAGSIMGARSSVGRAGGLSKPSSPRTKFRRECRSGLHSLWYERSWLLSLSRLRTMLANADGNTSVEASVCGSSPQVLIITRRQHRSDGRMPSGLHGRRFESGQALRVL